MTRSHYAAMTAFALLLPLAATPQAGPGTRSVMDAHNCYPYGEWWADRIDRALSTGLPLAIEQDLAWHTDARRGGGWSVLAHGVPVSGEEMRMEEYFFERVRPLVEGALASGDSSKWPLITLNLDFKSEEPEHLRAVRTLLQKYSGWLSWALKTNGPDVRQPLHTGPILVLTGPSAEQQKVFYDDIAAGERVLVFGAAPEGGPPNYRRWVNYPWTAVEPEGQQKAGVFSEEARHRLEALVRKAHADQLWIRFYTLDAANQAERDAKGWFRNYSFRSPAAVRERWDAAISAGVDYIASDQYEELASVLRARGR